MNEIEIIKITFGYLIDYGFSFNSKYNYPGYACCFTNDKGVKINISNSGDYRDEYRIEFTVKKGSKILISYFDDTIVNEDLNGVDEMVSFVNMIYQKAIDNRNGLTKKIFLEIIQAFAKFIKSNMGIFISYH